MFSITSAQPLSQGAEKESIRLLKLYVSLCKLCGNQISRYVLSLVDNIRFHVVPPLVGNIIAHVVPPLVGKIIAHVVPSLVGNIIAHVVPSLVANIIAHVVPPLVRHPQHTQISSNSSMIAAYNSKV